MPIIMDTGGFNPKLGSDSQDSDDIPPGTSGYEQPVFDFSTKNIKPSKNVPLTPKGVEQAKKRLRAFSIQKKSSLSPVSVPKPINTGNATVFIGRASGVKTTPKPELDPINDPKKPPKPPKPGAKQPQESYINTQKKTLAEIEDMKRKMELVELGIPLGLICPAPNSDKAMPTKAMPPIKTFLDSDKVDQLIREAKQAREEGKEFKFDYRKLLPDYANPFQRNKSTPEVKEAPETSKSNEHEFRKSRERDKRRSDKIYDIRRHSSYKSDKDRYREDKYHDKSSERDDNVKERDKPKDNDSKYKDRDSKYREKEEKSKNNDLKIKERDNRSKNIDTKKEDVKKDVAKDEKEAEVDLKDFVVCDSWSENEEKSKDSTPKLQEIKKRIEEQVKETTLIVDPMDQLRESLGKKEKLTESPKPKLKRLNPVVDSFKFEIEEPDEDILDMFDENYGTEKYLKVKCKKEKELDSPDMQLFDFDDAKEGTFDGMADDTFLESVINEIKQEEIDETSQDKGLVEYDESPSKDGEGRGSVTPEMDDRVRQIHSSRSEYSDGYKSTESGYKSTDSLKIDDYKSDNELERIVEEKQRELERMVDGRKLAKYTVDSLETWSFVLKICQPLLFRHDRNKCYKETRIVPKLWYTENPKLCNCVKDRRVVYEELEMCKMELVDNLYREQQASPPPSRGARGWFPALAQWARGAPAASEWETEDSHHQPATPDLSLDKEYQRFMEAVWPEVSEPKSDTPRSTPVRQDKKKADDELEAQKKAKKSKTSSEGWSQESDVEEEVDKSYNALQDLLYEALHYNPSSDTSLKKVKVEKPKRKRKHSTSTSVTDSSESDAKKRKKMQKKKDQKSLKKSKSKDTKRRRVSKKNIKKLKEKQRKKKKIIEIDEDSDLKDLEKEKKKKDKKIKKKKQLKQKRKNQKKKKVKAKSSSSSDSSSDSESEPERKSKKKKKDTDKKKKHKNSLESQEELFDVNILKNIKTEKETDEEMTKQLEFSPRRQKPREIINVKELQNDFVGNSIQIKKEVEQDEQKNKEESRDSAEEKVQRADELPEKQEESRESQIENVQEKESPPDFREQEESQSTPQLPPDESNQSQCSSQESIYSLKDQPIYEKDESHLRPSSQNSNYSFHDVMASGMYTKNIELAKQKNLQRLEHEMQSHEHDMQRHEHDSRSREHDVHSQEQDTQTREHDVESRKHDIHRHEHDISREHDKQSREHESQSHEHEIQNHEHDMQSHEHDMDCHEYAHGNYEMYEQMAMAYQSDVASQRSSSPGGSGERRIETVVRARSRGEIKCDWRAGDGGARPAAPRRPSRWGLKPGDVNIVLTGGEHSPDEPVYKIQSIANRTDNSVTGYDEAYMDMYGAADKLQYGDCFSNEERGVGGAAGGGGARATIAPHASSLDHRIDLALRTTVLGEVAKDLDETDEKDGPERGILVTKSLSVSEARGAKRVSFADGYKPGQDSDVEEPPVKKKKKVRRVGCAWPCPATHPDHVPLWDALPPPPPPPGSPPPPAPAPAPPTHLLRQGRTVPGLLPPPHAAVKFDPNSMPAFMPPEPPPGLISFQNL